MHPEPTQEPSQIDIEKQALRDAQGAAQVWALLGTFEDLIPRGLPGIKDLAVLLGLSREPVLLQRVAEKHNDELSAMVEHWGRCVQQKPEAEARRYLTRCIRGPLIEPDLSERYLHRKCNGGLVT